MADWGAIGTHSIASRLQLGVAIATGTGVGRYALGTHRTLGLADGLTVVATILNRVDKAKKYYLTRY